MMLNFKEPVGVPPREGGGRATSGRRGGKGVGRGTGRDEGRLVEDQYDLENLDCTQTIRINTIYILNRLITDKHLA